MTEKIDIKTQLDQLIRLQDIDAQIYRLNSEKKARPYEIKELKDSLAEKQSGMKEAEDALKKLQLKRKEKEVELGAKEEGVKKLQAQLYQLKTNKEYTAMLHEIEAHKADNSLLEEDIIKLMDEIDIVSAKVSEEKKRFEEESKKTDSRIKVIEDRTREIDADLSELKKKREEISPNIDVVILSGYERILAGKEGLALVEVVNDACGGCYMQLPPQVINEIRMKEHVVRCGSCQRILYIKDE